MVDRQFNVVETLRRSINRNGDFDSIEYFDACAGNEESLAKLTGGLWASLSIEEKEAVRDILFKRCAEIAIISSRSDEITYKTFSKSLANARSHKVLGQLAQALPSRIKINNGITSSVAARVNLINICEMYQGFGEQGVDMLRKFVTSTLAAHSEHKDATVKPIILCNVPIAIYTIKFSQLIDEEEAIGSTRDINLKLEGHFAAATQSIAALKEVQNSTNFSVSDVICAPPGVMVAVASTRFATEFVNQFFELGKFATDLPDEPMYIKVGEAITSLSAAEFQQSFWQLLFNKAKSEGRLVNYWRVYYEEEQLFAEEIIPEVSFGEKVKLHKGNVRAARNLLQLKAAIQLFWGEAEIREVLIPEVKGVFHRLLATSDPQVEHELRELLNLPKPEVKTKEATPQNESKPSKPILISGKKLEIDLDNKSDLRHLAQILAVITEIDNDSLFRSLKSNTGIGALIKSLSTGKLPKLNARTFANADGSFSYLFETSTATINIKVSVINEYLHIQVSNIEDSVDQAEDVELIQAPADQKEEVANMDQATEAEFIADMLQQSSINNADYEKLKEILNEVSTMSRKKLPAVVDFIAATLQSENCAWLKLNISTPRQFSYERLAKSFIEYVISLPWGEAAFNHFNKDTIKFLDKLAGWSAKTTTAWKDEYSNEDRIQIIRVMSNQDPEQFGFVISLTPNNHS